MQLSVIILNYNVRYFLEQCVQSVQDALKHIDGEIIVVDNNSPDDSCAMMKRQFPDVTLIENKENSGFPKGNNIGVAAAKGKYICILNPDTVVAGDTFKKVLDFACKQQNLGIIGVKLADGKGCFLPESKRGVPTPWVAATKIGGFYKIFPGAAILNKYYAQHLGENQAGKVDILVGAFMVMERKVYLNAGGFDEDCFMYSDDIDLSYTILKKGLDNYYLPETTIIHYKGESTVKDGTYMNRFREAMQFFYKKHFRSSPAFDLFMRGGTLFFTLLKKNKRAVAVKPSEYILLSDDECLRVQLEEKLEKKVSRVADYKGNIPPQPATTGAGHREIIFDNDYIAYTDIIYLMEIYSRKEFTFKIKPAGTHYLIGSNNSYDRGEVIILEKEAVQNITTNYI